MREGKYMNNVTETTVAAALERSGHRCAQAGCDERATSLIMESNYLSLLFRSGAGVLCDKHAKAMQAVGGVKIDYIGVEE